MKKLFFLLLITAILCSSLYGCSGNKKYKLISVPEELQINVETLSEDPSNILDYSEDYPLFFAEPENGVYAYICEMQSVNGLLIKFENYIQFFPWRFVTVLANPDVHVTDYNGDGLSDIAVTIVSDVGETNYNEDLHLLINRDGSLEDCFYSNKTCATDASGILTFSKNPNKGNSYFFFVNGKKQEIELKNKGECFGLYMDAVQDFTLGDKITVEIVPGLMFENNLVPDYSIAKFHAEVNYNSNRGVFEMINCSVDF